MSAMEATELVFVVDVTSFTEKGFVGTTSHLGRKVDVEFDDGDEGLFLSPEMAKSIGVKKGSPASVIVEDGTTTISQTLVTAVGKVIRVSDARVYYAIGREGGGVVRVRRA